MSVLRSIGWILFALGLVLLGYDLLPALLQHAPFRPISLNGFIGRSGVIGPAIIIVERLWNLFDAFVLRPGWRLVSAAWAFAVFLIVGALLLTATGGLRSRR